MPATPASQDPTRFVLLHTSHAGNVGAAARAMKVMGFSDLVLVQPRFADVLSREETVAMASGAADVLTRARIVPTLSEALHGITHAVATAMTPRDFGPPVHAPRALFGTLAPRSAPRALQPAADRVTALGQRREAAQVVGGGVVQSRHKACVVGDCDPVIPS